MGTQAQALRIDELLEAAVADGVAPGIVAVAADARGVVYEGAAGRRSLDDDAPMTLDTIVRIASMTKAVTSVAALQLIERGVLALDEAVADVRPEFGELQVLEGFDGDAPRLRPPATQATVRHLLTHTAGLTYWIWNADTTRYEEVTGTPNVGSGLEDAFTLPLAFDPGTGWQYGMNHDWLGRVVETVSSQPLDEYLAEHVFGPLGMTETGFAPSDEQRSRMAPVHARGEDGTVVVTEFDWAQTPDFWAGGHALYGTAGDYLRLQRALLGGGALEGTRILRPETVDAMFRNHIGDLHSGVSATVHPDLSNDAEFFPGMRKKWGLGLELVTADVPGARRAGSGHWGGLFNTYFWIDRAGGLTGAVHTQLLPFADPQVLDVFAAFERAIYAART